MGCRNRVVARHVLLMADTMTNPTQWRRSTEDVFGEQLFRVDEGDLQPGTYILGVFNMDYFVHSAFTYQLEVCT